MENSSSSPSFTELAQKAIESSALNRTDSVGSLVFYTCGSEDYGNFRSLVWNKDTSSVASIAFPYTHELTECHLVRDDFNTEGMLFTKSHEGTIIRMFYDHDSNEWKVSTLRKAEAQKHRWGTPQTFYEMFINALRYHGVGDFDDWCSGMSKDHTHTFLLFPTSGSRLVCEVSRDIRVMYTGSFNNSLGTASFEMLSSIPDVPRCEWAYMTLEELDHAVRHTDISECQGMFGYKDGSFYKIYNSAYLTAKLLRGNEPDLRKRYLQTLHDPEFHRRFREHFHDHARLFRRLDGCVHALIRDIKGGNLHPQHDALLSAQEQIHTTKNHKSLHRVLSGINHTILFPSIKYRLGAHRNQSE